MKRSFNIIYLFCIPFTLVLYLENNKAKPVFKRFLVNTKVVPRSHPIKRCIYKSLSSQGQLLATPLGRLAQQLDFCNVGGALQFKHTLSIWMNLAYRTRIRSVTENFNQTTRNNIYACINGQTTVRKMYSNNERVYAWYFYHLYYLLTSDGTLWILLCL